MGSLRVFSDDTDTCIAESLDDAMTVMDEYGTTEQDPELWGPVDDAAEITIWCDDNGNPAVPGDGAVREITKTAAEWAQRGRGFLCTTEF